VFLPAHIVAMVTYCATKLTATYFPMIVQFVDIYAPFTNHSPKQKTSERANIYQTKKDVLKNRYISDYLMLVAFSSPVKFSKSVFSGVKFRAKFEVVLQKQFLPVAAYHSK